MSPAAFVSGYVATARVRSSVQFTGPVALLRLLFCVVVCFRQPFVDWISLAVVIFCLLLFMALAVLGYDPARGLVARRGGAE